MNEHETDAGMPEDISVEDLNELLKIRREKLAELQRKNADPFTMTKYDVTHHSGDIINDFEKLAGTEVSVAGRMMTKRVMGKAAFCDIQDLAGKIQVYVRKDELGEECYAEFKHCDIGDIFGIRGEVFRTQKGEISVKAHALVLLSKSLQVLPEKWHGLKDQELRYRQRYLDLIVNPDVKETFIKRSLIMKSIRGFLDKRDRKSTRLNSSHT